jgi:hypothetical protein
VKIYIKSLFLFLVTIFSNQSIDASQHQKAFAISTIPQAIIALRKIVLNFPTESNTVILQNYEKEQSGTIVECAKVLYDVAYVQILETLQEINSRIAYWRYQKSHPWIYFLAKNPMKWVTGSSQKDEVEHHLDQLQSHQGELYVLLGQLAEHGNMYDHKYKSVFKADYIQAYAWVDGLLDLLIRIKIPIKNVDEMSSFMVRIQLLKAKLERVRFFKNQLLSEMKDTQIPRHVERHWLKYGAAALTLGWGYQNIGLKQIEQSLESIKNNVTEYIIDPVRNIMKDVFRGSEGEIENELLIPQENIEAAKVSIKDFVNNLSSISDEQKKEIEHDIDLGRSSSFQSLLDALIANSRWNPTTWMNYFVGKTLLGQFLGGQAGGKVQQQLANIQKQYIGVGKIAVLTPTILSSWLAYRSYKAFNEKDYSQIRRALVDINSLFVDTSKPLDDEQYGKMLYLIYDLKKRITQEKRIIQGVQVNDRMDFIDDLEHIESKEFDVAAKRRIVEDMFRKYSFLGLS